MKQVLAISALVLLFSCNNDTGFTRAEDAQDAGREFIRASLDGNYNKALFYLYKDQEGVNQRLLDKWKKDYDRLSQADKVGYKEANIIVINAVQQNDSTLNYEYSNSYKKDTTTIKIIRASGDWVVDLKDIH